MCAKQSRWRHSTLAKESVHASGMSAAPFLSCWLLLSDADMHTEQPAARVSGTADNDPFIACSASLGRLAGYLQAGNAKHGPRLVSGCMHYAGGGLSGAVMHTIITHA